ncbi:MAG: ADP-ribosylglycohydrolase family protein [Anaerolineaceae bacterium]|nr:ADP-ribosylglycohydrolase family protein [Anaerolineaceae bacterium]
MTSKSLQNKVIGMILGLVIAETLLEQFPQHDGNIAGVQIAEAISPSYTQQLLSNPDATFQSILNTHYGLRPLLNLCFQEVPPSQWLLRLLDDDELPTGMEQALHRIGHVVGWGSQTRAIKHIRASGVEDTMLPIALYFLMHNIDSPISGITAAVELEPASWHIAVVVGMATGALYGVEIFPSAWLDYITDLPKLTQIAAAHGDEWLGSL